MSKRLRYRLYSGNLATVHESNKLEDLIKLGRVLKATGKQYVVKDLSGNVVWEGCKDA